MIPHKFSEEYQLIHNLTIVLLKFSHLIVMKFLKVNPNTFMLVTFKDYMMFLLSQL